jgi:glycosyltransferase involved in cell wall biosynthesis
MTRRPQSIDAPLVSVGLPVFNGENFVAHAIQSVLAQTLTDFELIIQDNASTDRTADICREFAAGDPRVRYFRNPRNLGAAPNYNLAYSMARGRYFKWLAHDDYIEPAYLAETSRVLEERPEAVLCNAVVRYIWGDGADIGLYDSGLARADVASPAARFAAMVLPSHSCVDFFGLMRKDAMKHSLLHASFHGGDRALLAQMALRGRLVQLAEPLAVMREHGERYTRQKSSPAQSLTWHDASMRRAIAFPTWRLYAEYLKMVRHEALGTGERVRCYGVLAQWWACNWNSARAAVDVLGIVAPGARTAAWRLKTRVFGAAPGHFMSERRR